jgi:tetratricopeptide (TPR) repeat protein
LNLAHSYRKLGNYSDAEKYFLKVDSITSTGPAKASALAGLGFIYQITGEVSSAVECYHKVLAMKPTDQIASEMLKRIMEDRVRVSEMEWMHEYLPDDLKNDDDVDRRARNLLDRSHTTITEMGYHGEGSSSTAAVVPDPEYHGEDVVSDDEYHGEGSSSSAAAIVEAEYHGEGSSSSSAASLVVSGGRGKRKGSASSAYSARATRTRKDTRSGAADEGANDESMEMEET